MNHRTPLLFLLCSLSLAASAFTQIPQVRKVVVHDHGGLWPETFAVYTDGSVRVYGNPWLGGGCCSLISGGVTDLARLDALTVGDSEAVLMVGASGLVTATWNQCEHDFDVETWSHPLLLNALMVRTARFAPDHLVVVLAEGGHTLRVFREGSTNITSFTMTEPVLDYEIVRNASGAARLFVVTTSGFTCRQPNGTVDWALPGIGGGVVRWPADPTTRAGWLHRDMASGAWQIARLGDSGALGFDAIHNVIDNEQEVVAAFPVDGDADGDVDWIVKSSNGLSVLQNDGTNHFELAIQGPVLQTLADPDSIPDLVVTHGGAHVYVVDDHGFTALSWNGIDMADGNGWEEDIDLEGWGLFDTAVTEDSRVDFDVRVSTSLLQSFANENATTYLQVVSWRQAQATVGGRLDDEPESNILYPLDGNLGEITENVTYWPLTVTMSPDWDPEYGWASEEHFWLTVRLVMIPHNTSDPMTVSDPVTIATTLSDSQRDNDWPFVLGYVPGTLSTALPRVLPPPPQPHGGGVVGVITRIKVPPPPPQSGLPSPSDADVAPFSIERVGPGGAGGH